jgi:hypothetical protein
LFDECFDSDLIVTLTRLPLNQPILTFCLVVPQYRYLACRDWRRYWLIEFLLFNLRKKNTTFNRKWVVFFGLNWLEISWIFLRNFREKYYVLEISEKKIMYQKFPRIDIFVFSYLYFLRIFFTLFFTYIFNPFFNVFYNPFFLRIFLSH